MFRILSVKIERAKLTRRLSVAVTDKHYIGGKPQLGTVLNAAKSTSKSCENHEDSSAS